MTAAPHTDQQPLRDRIAEAIRADLKKAIPPWEPFPGGPKIGGMGRTEYDLADAVLAVVQPELDQYRAKRDQFADRVDTLTAVCKSNALAHRVAVEECERLRVERERVLELIESSTEAWLTNPSVNMRTALALLRDETAAVSDPTTTP